MKTATHSKSRHVGSDPVKHIIQNLLRVSRKGKQERLRKDSHKAPDKEESGKKKVLKKKEKKKVSYITNAWLLPAGQQVHVKISESLDSKLAQSETELKQLTCEELTHNRKCSFSITHPRNMALKHQHLPGVLSVPWHAENAGQINSTTSHSCGFYLPSPLPSRKELRAIQVSLVVSLARSVSTKQCNFLLSADSSCALLTPNTRVSMMGLNCNELLLPPQ